MPLIDHTTLAHALAARRSTAVMSDLLAVRAELLHSSLARLADQLEPLLAVASLVRRQQEIWAVQAHDGTVDAQDPVGAAGETAQNPAGLPPYARAAAEASASEPVSVAGRGVPTPSGQSVSARDAASSVIAASDAVDGGNRLLNPAASPVPPSAPAAARLAGPADAGDAAAIDAALTIGRPLAEGQNSWPDPERRLLSELLEPRRQQEPIRLGEEAAHPPSIEDRDPPPTLFTAAGGAEELPTIRLTLETLATRQERMNDAVARLRDAPARFGR